MENQASIRMHNIALLRHLRGTHKQLVEELQGIANWNAVSDFALGRRRISDYTARAIEGRLKLPERWLDRDHRACLNVSADAYALFALVQAVSPEVREAVKTILEFDGGAPARGEAQGSPMGARLSLVKSGSAAQTIRKLV